MKQQQQNSLAISRNKKKNWLQPHERFELSTSGLRDQCSNHCAYDADTLVFKIDKTKKQRSKQKKNSASKERQLD